MYSHVDSIIGDWLLKSDLGSPKYILDVFQLLHMDFNMNFSSDWFYVSFFLILYSTICFW